MALAALALLLIPLPMLAKPEVEGFTSPSGFQDDLVATIHEPVSLEVIPSGTDQGAILVAEKEGQLWWVETSSPDESLVVDLRSTTCDEGERGLLGIALDPQFATNRYVYLYRTFEDGNTCRNRVSRFVLGNDRTIDPLTEQVLLQTSALGPTNHNGGDIHFGADGHLYIAVGDNATRANAQRKDNFFGKILRITTSGTAPQDNPFMGAGSQACAATGTSDNQADCQEIYAFGLRNPFRFAFDPSGDRFWINDVGEVTWEEIDKGIKGANYGWPEREGRCATGETRKCKRQPAGYTPPIYAYNHAIGCDSITGGAIVPSNSDWPKEYIGDYLFADFICGKVWALNRPNSAKRAEATVLFRRLGSVVDMQFDPTDPNRLLYTLYSGEVRAITYGN